MVEQIFWKFAWLSTHVRTGLELYETAKFGGEYCSQHSLEQCVVWVESLPGDQWQHVCPRQALIVGLFHSGLSQVAEAGMTNATYVPTVLLLVCATYHTWQFLSLIPLRWTVVCCHQIAQRPRLMWLGRIMVTAHINMRKSWTRSGNAPLSWPYCIPLIGEPIDATHGEGVLLGALLEPYVITSVRSTVCTNSSKLCPVCPGKHEPSMSAATPSSFNVRVHRVHHVWSGAFLWHGSRVWPSIHWRYRRSLGWRANILWW